jgi:hypothetical protein
MGIRERERWFCHGIIFIRKCNQILKEYNTSDPMGHITGDGLDCLRHATGVDQTMTDNIFISDFRIS